MFVKIKWRTRRSANGGCAERAQRRELSEGGGRERLFHQTGERLPLAAFRWRGFCLSVSSEVTGAGLCP